MTASADAQAHVGIQAAANCLIQLVSVVHHGKKPPRMLT